MKNKQLQSRLMLVGALILILGGIYYLESSKVSPTADALDQDIDVSSIINDKDAAEAEFNDQEISGRNSTTETKDETENRLAMKKDLYEPAKEISSPDGFINVEDVNITDLIGKKIILVDFWTYSCINCQRTLPYLNNWHEKYSDDGLVILGLHTPEFEFEKDYDNVSRAVVKWNIKYPVILDNDYSTWRSYKNRYWPRKYLIDIDGFIVYDHIGEGGYDETEEKIVELLNEKNELFGDDKVVVEDLAPQNIDEVNFSQVGSPETYLGSSRLERIANLPDKNCIGRTCEYVAEEPFYLNSFELSGRWNIEPEEAILMDETGSIFYRFKANKVNLVVGNGKGKSAKIYLDGKLVGNEIAGSHVKDGVVQFDEDDLYNLIDQKGEYSEHLLEIRFEGRGVEAFAFTFG